MKLIKSFSTVLLALSAAMLVTGCHSTAPKTTLLPGPNGRGGGDSAMSPGAKFGGDSSVTDQNGNHAPNDANNHAGYVADAATLSPQTVYFDLDKSAIKQSEQSKLGEVASYLKSNPDKALRVEGNCDERGTEEYNRSLGERRALAAREFLIQSGIDPQRVDTLSNGEDKPALNEHNEEAWTKNRRDEFIVLTPPRL